MEAAFVEIGLEKNGFLYVDEIVGPELEGRRHGRRIQDLLARGQEILVQAVKDPMKSKGARLTTEISLPGRFVVYVPQGEGIGVSRRLDDDERTRLKDILRELDLPTGGLIVRTAAEGASAEDIERDIGFLEKLWKEIQARAKKASAPSLVYHEAELPLRVVRDLFTDDFERALVDDDRALKRISGYLKKTSPHMAERVPRYRDEAPLFETYGVDAIRSTLTSASTSRRAAISSSTTRRRSRSSTSTPGVRRLAVEDLDRTARGDGDEEQRRGGEGGRPPASPARYRRHHRHRLRRHGEPEEPGDGRGGAEARARARPDEDVRRRDLPLGLVEMTRQNVTEGPREILTKRCPECEGNGFVVSEASSVVDTERRLRTLASQSPRTKAFEVELNARVRDLLVGPGASQLEAIEDVSKRRFFLAGKPDAPLDHFHVKDKGPIERLAPKAAVEEGQELDVKLVEVGLYDADAGVAKLDGIDVAVAGAAKLVGKKVHVRIERVLDGTAFATLAGGTAAADDRPITAEGMAEKPTRAARSRRRPAEGAAEDVALASS